MKTYLIILFVLMGIELLELILNALIPIRCAKAKIILLFISLTTMLISLGRLFSLIKAIN
jgi:hypothetical protein